MTILKKIIEISKIKKYKRTNNESTFGLEYKPPARILASEEKWIKFSRQLSDPKPYLPYFIKQITPVDIVIVEGFKDSDHTKVEVVDILSDRKPLYETDRTICGLIINRQKIQNLGLPQFERDDVQKICDFIEETIGIV